MASEIRVLKRVVGLTVRLDGEQHRSWLPLSAAEPLPTPVRDVLVDLEIQFDGSSYLLVRAAQDGSFCWDSWHKSLQDAESAEAEEYGVQAPQWQCG